MTLQEYINKNGDREIKDVGTLDSILEPEKPKTVWDLEIGDVYFWLTDRGSVNETEWDNGIVAVGNRYMGNVFLAEDECKLERDRRLFLIDARREAEKDGWKPDWKDDKQDKWYWGINHKDGIVELGASAFFARGDTVYFQSKEAINAFLTEENKAEIMRLWGN